MNMILKPFYPSSTNKKSPYRSNSRTNGKTISMTASKN